MKPVGLKPEEMLAEAEKIRKLYIKCVQEEKEKRPSIKEVIEILEECYSTEK